MASSPTFLSDGHTPNNADTRLRVLQKILGATIDGGGVGSGVQFGDGVNPPTDPTKPAIYYPDTGGAMLNWSVGSQAWLVLLMLLMVVNCFGAQLSEKDFRGSGGITVSSNATTHLVTIDGSGIASPTGGVSAAVATNIANAAASSKQQGSFVLTNFVLMGISNILAGPCIALLTNNGVLWVSNTCPESTLTNANQFGASPLLTLKDGFSATNPRLYGTITQVQNSGAYSFAPWNPILFRNTGGGEFDDADQRDRIDFTPGGAVRLRGTNEQPALTISKDGDGTFAGTLAVTGSATLNNGMTVSGDSATFLNSASVAGGLNISSGDVTLSGSGKYAGNGNGITNLPSAQTNATHLDLNASTSGLKTLSAGANIIITNQGTNLAIASTASGGSATPGGNSGAIQFNEGVALDGTNDLVFNRSNRVVFLNGAIYVTNANGGGWLTTNGTMIVWATNRLDGANSNSWLIVSNATPALTNQPANGGHIVLAGSVWGAPGAGKPGGVTNVMWDVQETNIQGATVSSILNFDWYQNQVRSRAATLSSAGLMTTLFGFASPNFTVSQFGALTANSVSSGAGIGSTASSSSARLTMGSFEIHGMANAGNACLVDGSGNDWHSLFFGGAVTFPGTESPTNGQLRFVSSATTIGRFDWLTGDTNASAPMTFGIFVQPKTANYTIKTNESASLFTNTGASGAQTNQLPVTWIGHSFKFACVAAQTISASVLLPGTDTISFMGNTGTNLFSSTIGNTAELICVATNKWFFFGNTNGWTLQ